MSILRVSKMMPLFSWGHCGLTTKLVKFQINRCQMFIKYFTTFRDPSSSWKIKVVVRLYCSPYPMNQRCLVCLFLSLILYLLSKIQPLSHESFITQSNHIFGTRADKRRMSKVEGSLNLSNLRQRIFAKQRSEKSPCLIYYNLQEYETNL